MPNRLAEETSPYLLQHRDNPVDWYPWGEEALARARREDLPILVSIGYSACHWCHVMERESFEDPETAAYMNENFVCIKVDREERPDIDALYMEAVQGITGQGGWPLTVFCDSDAVPFHGGTYFPPQPTGSMPSFQMVMEAVVNTYRLRRDEIRERSGQMIAQLGALGRLRAPDEASHLEPSLLEEAERGLMRLADRIAGGFGGAPKFPPASALEFLLGRGQGEFVGFTLDRMIAGGIYDQLGGGFARYSVDAAWQIPHFEKMLYDNALLARTCLHAWQELGHERYRRVCRETLDWALAEMRSPEGGFYSALDADSEGEEGRFYIWRADEFRKALDAAGFSGEEIAETESWFGVTDHGNFEGANVLHLRAGAGDEVPETVSRARRALKEARERRVRPGLDDKCLTSWNALMVAALAEAGVVLREPRYLNAARQCAHLILTRLRDDQGRLLRSLTAGKARLNAYLEDHAYLLEALIILHEATFEAGWIKEARAIADQMIARFGDPAGGFFTTSHDHERLIARRKDLGDHPIPSGNASATMGLLRLAGLTGEASYREQAMRTLAIFAKTASGHPDSFGHMLQALALGLDGGSELAVLGPAGCDPSPIGTDLGPLCEIAWSRHRPLLVRSGGQAGDDIPELLRGRDAVEGKPSAYLCRNFACRLPVTDPADLARQLDG